MSINPDAACLYCDRNETQVPLIPVKFQGESYWICAQHLPILIHEPGKLAGRLPGAEQLSGGKHSHGG